MFGSVARRYLRPFTRLRDSWPSRREPNPDLEALLAGSWKKRLEIARRASLRWTGADRQTLEASMKLNRELVEKGLLER